MTSVFILGAGFSKQLHDSMPTLAQLWDPLAEHVRKLVPDIYDEWLPMEPDFEALLTYLGTHMPFADEARSLENQALFLRISEWLGQELWERQQHATGSQLPDWLDTLIGLWNSSRSVVVTLNYDTLIEAAAVSRSERIAYTSLYPIPLPSVNARLGGTFGPELGDSFELIKLHGSLNWCFSGAKEFFGEQIYDIGEVGLWNRSEPKRWSEVREKAREMAPLIIPPTLSKSLYFENAIVRGLWKRASIALQLTQDVFVIGYSVPLGDLQMRALFNTTCHGKRVFPVNPDTSVTDRLREVLPKTAQIDSTYAGDGDGIVELVARLAKTEIE